MIPDRPWINAKHPWNNSRTTLDQPQIDPGSTHANSTWHATSTIVIHDELSVSIVGVHAHVRNAMTHEHVSLSIIGITILDQVSPLGLLVADAYFKVCFCAGAAIGTA